MDTSPLSRSRFWIGYHRPHICRIHAVGQVEQAATGSLLDKEIEYLVNNLFEIGEEAIDRVSGQQSIKSTAKPDDRVLKLSFACLLYSIWRAVDLLVQVELTGEYELSPIVTADNTLTLLKKETGVG
jgi:hypothetical protein